MYVFQTAEMPDFYSAGEYDLSGFAVGTLWRKILLLMEKIFYLEVCSSAYLQVGFIPMAFLLKEGYNICMTALLIVIFVSICTLLF